MFFVNLFFIHLDMGWWMWESSRDKPTTHTVLHHFIYLDKFSLIFFRKTTVHQLLFQFLTGESNCNHVMRVSRFSVANSACPVQTSLLQPSYTVTRCCSCLFTDGSCIDITTELIDPRPNESGVIEFLSREAWVWTGKGAWLYYTLLCALWQKQQISNALHVMGYLERLMIAHPCTGAVHRVA
jgi:hypothetical protein